MTSTQLQPGTPIKIAILAMGGQGGGVLADWIVDMAEHSKWWAQTTSVPGVAQRTGATIYYLEMLPETDVQHAGKPPALAMMPTPGDVDVVVAAGQAQDVGGALRRANAKFERRFRAMEAMAAADGGLAGQTLDAQDRYWERAKAAEKGGPG